MTNAAGTCSPRLKHQHRAPVIAKRYFCVTRQFGFTLVELVIVIVVLGIMSAYAIMNSASPSELSLPSQAATMASDIRHTQTLAHTTGNRMRLTIVTGANGSYSSASCDTSNVCSNVFSVSLEKNVVLGGATTTLYFDTLGQPKTSANVATSASYTLAYGGSTKTINVAALTGFVTVTP